MDVTIREQITYGIAAHTAADFLLVGPPSGAILHEWHLTRDEQAALDDFYAHMPSTDTGTSVAAEGLPLPTLRGLFHAVIAIAPQIRAEREQSHVAAVVRGVLVKLLETARTRQPTAPWTFDEDECEQLQHAAVDRCRTVALPAAEQELVVSGLGRKCHAEFSKGLEDLWARELALAGEKEQLLRGS